MIPPFEIVTLPNSRIKYTQATINIAAACASYGSVLCTALGMSENYLYAVDLKIPEIPETSTNKIIHEIIM